MKTKKCSTCNLEYPIDMFYRCGKTKKGVQRYSNECKECRKSREIKRYYELKDDILPYKRACTHCGVEKPYLIEFHHKNPSEKEFIISHWRKKSRFELIAELKKCDPLCRNCHEEFHYLNRTLGISYDEYLNKY